MAFREEGVELRCTVNEDNLWIAVKDNLLLAEYEREGVSLRDVSGVVVDAGAHVGVFSLLASVHARSVVAIEAPSRQLRRSRGERQGATDARTSPSGTRR